MSLYADTTPFNHFYLIENLFSVDPIWAILEVNFPSRPPDNWHVLTPGYERVLRGNKFQRGQAGDLQYFTEVTANKYLNGRDFVGGGTPIADRVTGEPCVLTGFSSGFDGYGDIPESIETWEFTPSDSSTLFLLHGVRNGAHTTAVSPTITDTSGATWTLVTSASELSAAGEAYQLTLSLYKLETGTGLTWRKVIFDPYATAAIGYQSMYIFEVPNTLGMTLAQAVVTSGDHNPSFGGFIDTFTSDALGSAATSGNLAMAFYATAHAVEGGITVPAGWNVAGNFYEGTVTTGLLWRTDFTGTTVTIADLGTEVDNVVVAMTEYEL